MDRGINDLVRRIGGEDQRPEGVVRLATTESMSILLMRGLVPLRTAPQIGRRSAGTGTLSDDRRETRADRR